MTTARSAAPAATSLFDLAIADTEAVLDALITEHADNYETLQAAQAATVGAKRADLPALKAALSVAKANAARSLGALISARTAAAWAEKLNHINVRTAA